MREIQPISLPQELLDKIIDSVDPEELPTLRSLSCTSSALMPRARQRAFNHLTVFLDEDFGGRNGSLKGIVGLLDVADNTISKYVTSLSVNSRPSGYNIVDKVHCVDMVNTYIPILFSHLSNIETLSLDSRYTRLVWQDFTPDFHLALYNICHSPRLSALHICYLSIPCRVIVDCPNLKSLSLFKASLVGDDDILHKESATDARPALASPTRLQSFQIRQDTSCFIDIPYPALQNIFMALEVLTIDFGARNDSTLRKILSEASESLVSLSIPIDYWTAPRTSQLKSLRNLDLLFMDNVWCTPGRSTVTLELLQDLYQGSPLLQSISFKLYKHGLGHLFRSVEAWTSIFAIITKWNLRNVHITYSCQPPHQPPTAFSASLVKDLVRKAREICDAFESFNSGISFSFEVGQKLTDSDRLEGMFKYVSAGRL